MTEDPADEDGSAASVSFDEASAATDEPSLAVDANDDDAVNKDIRTNVYGIEGHELEMDQLNSHECMVSLALERAFASTAYLLSRTWFSLYRSLCF